MLKLTVILSCLITHIELFCVLVTIWFHPYHRRCFTLQISHVDSFQLPSYIINYFEAWRRHSVICFSNLDTSCTSGGYRPSRLDRTMLLHRSVLLSSRDRHGSSSKHSCVSDYLYIRKFVLSNTEVSDSSVTGFSLKATYLLLSLRTRHFAFRISSSAFISTSFCLLFS